MNGEGEKFIKSFATNKKTLLLFSLRSFELTRSDESDCLKFYPDPEIGKRSFGMKLFLKIFVEFFGIFKFFNQY